MNERKLIIIEKLKTILIVVLTLSTILLLYFFWSDVSLKDLSIDDFNLNFGEESEAERLTFPEDVVLPLYMEIINSEGESQIAHCPAEIYGKSTQEGSFAGTLAGLFVDGEAVVEEFPMELYDEVYQYSAVKCYFGYNIPAREYVERLGADKLTGIENLSSVTEVGFTNSVPDSLLVFDGSQNKTYRIIFEKKINYVDSILAGGLGAEYPICYHMTDYMGAQVKNQLLIPLYLNSNLESVDIKHLLGHHNENRINEEAKSFFGNTFDFVRKIEDANGKVTYMYGYAEMVLILDVDGSVEYKSASEGKATLGFYDSLDLALAFVDRHTIVPISAVQGSRYVLAKASRSTEGEKTYRFEFQQEVGNTDIFSQSPPLVVEITGGVVTYYYINQLSIDSSESANQSKEAFSAINTIATNYKYIADKLTLENQPKSEDFKSVKLTVDDVAEKIVNMRYGYAIISEKAVPACEIRVKGLENPLYFDLYTAEPLENKEER